MHIAFVGLGSNLGNPASTVRLGIAALAELPLTQVVAASSLYLSAPVGHAGQPDFVNAVAKISTGFSPQTLLAALLAIEQRHGRERSFRNAPRTLDLDLLLYDADSFAGAGLSVPHPRMHERAFVLAPLIEIAPDCVIPGVGAASGWLARCAGQSFTRIGTA